MTEIILSADGVEFDRDSLIEDEDGLWAPMGGALALIKPSAAYDARREADAAAEAVDRAARLVVADREAAVQAEMRAMAEERLAKKGI